MFGAMFGDSSHWYLRSNRLLVYSTEPTVFIQSRCGAKIKQTPPVTTDSLLAGAVFFVIFSVHVTATVVETKKWGK